MTQDAAAVQAALTDDNFMVEVLDSILDRQNVMRKEFATLQAEFAFLGHTLSYSRRNDDGRTSFIVGRWGHHRHFDRIDDVRGFLSQIGGRP